jgi:hypothetical protein
MIDRCGTRNLNLNLTRKALAEPAALAEAAPADRFPAPAGPGVTVFRVYKILGLRLICVDFVCEYHIISESFCTYSPTGISDRRRVGVIRFSSFKLERVTVAAMPECRGHAPTACRGVSWPLSRSLSD